MLEVKWSGEIRFKDNLKVYVEMAEDHTVIKAVWIDELGNEYPLGTVPSVTDLGDIDPELYDGDVMEFMNTLTETGNYRFTFDEFMYFVEVQNVSDGITNNVYQHYWSTEEGGTLAYIRGLIINDGEIEDVAYTQYMTLDEATASFAPKSHVHYDTAAGYSTVWVYVNSMTYTNGRPLIYTDRSTSTQWYIESFVGPQSPNYLFQRLTNMHDPNVIYQRSGVRSGGRVTWGDWVQFTGFAEDVKPAIMPQGGIFTVSSVASNSYSDYSVTFPEPYDTAPIVVAGLAGTITAYGMGNVSVSAYNVTTTGFTARVYNASANARNITCRYIAISS